MRDETTGHRTNRRRVLKNAGIASALVTGLAGCTETLTGGSSGGGDGGDGYPNNDLRYIIPFSEGGGTDTFARQMIPVMGEELGTNIAIENIPGSASLRGTGELYHAEPDGYTFGGFNPPSTPVSAMVNPPDFEMQELKGVGAYARTPFVIVANPEHEIEGFEDLVSRYQSGELETFSGKQKGGVDHVLALLMRDNQEYDLAWQRYVGYDGSGPAVQATVSGEVPVAISTDTAAQGAAEDGRVDTVVSLSSEGSGVFPDLPAVTDVGYPNIDYLGQLRRCMYVPPETSDDHIQTLTEALEASLEDEELQQWAEDTGNVLEYGGPDVAETAVSDAFENIPDQVDLDEVREAN
ncbi:Bug family tripartite tricarboxylate transporter substrate binding protein [Halalkalicoccus sp. NIPERK01]|uniref:Bug family tripartite tricarboxylate transporter substrate binding protein n=1 Tax=Halalkalicoccus sp. NIPERK01 TaxID=3053469 RepID=UPI0034E9633E